MNSLTWLALVCYVLAFLGVLIFAAAYLIRSEFMPYHSSATARSWGDVDPAMQLLLLALIKVIGAPSLALGFAGLFLLYLLFAQSWSLEYLVAFQLFCLIAIAPPVVVGLYVRQKTKAPTPILSGSIVVLLTLAGFVFALVSGQLA